MTTDSSTSPDPQDIDVVLTDDGLDSAGFGHATERPVTVPNVSAGALSGIDHEVIGSAAQEAFDAQQPTPTAPETPDDYLQTGADDETGGQVTLPDGTPIADAGEDPDTPDGDTPIGDSITPDSDPDED